MSTSLRGRQQIVGGLFLSALQFVVVLTSLLLSLQSVRYGLIGSETQDEEHLPQHHPWIFLLVFQSFLKLLLAYDILLQQKLS